LIWSIFFGTFLSLILCLVALGRIKRNHTQGRGMAIVGVVISTLSLVGSLAVVGLWAAGMASVSGSVNASSSASSSSSALNGALPSSTVTKSADVKPSQVKTGDCISSFSEGDVQDLPVVPCNQPHAGQMIGSYQMTALTYPATSTITAEADKKCPAMAPKSLSKTKLKTLSFAYVYPTVRSWAGGDRQVQCFAVSDGAPLTAPLGK
jgi:hypothetical protein